MVWLATPGKQKRHLLKNSPTNWTSLLNQKKGREVSTGPTRRFTGTILATLSSPDLLEPQTPPGPLTTRPLQRPGGHFTTSSGGVGALRDPPPPLPPAPVTTEPTGRGAGGRCPAPPTPGQTWSPPTPGSSTRRAVSPTRTSPSTATSACARTFCRGQIGARRSGKDVRNVALTGRDLTRRI